MGTIIKGLQRYNARFISAHPIFRRQRALWTTLRPRAGGTNVSQLHAGPLPVDLIAQDPFILELYVGQRSLLDAGSQGPGCSGFDRSGRSFFAASIACREIPSQRFLTLRGPIVRIHKMAVNALDRSAHWLTCILIMTAVGCPYPVFAADNASYEYRGRDYVATGSSLARHLTWLSELPFDKSFFELSPSQQAFVRDQYADLRADDEPPYPKTGLQAIFRLVDTSSADLLRPGDHGEVMAIARVDSKGEVASVSVYKTTSSAATTAIAYALTNTEFKPGRRNGAPADMEYVLRATLK